MTDYYVQESNPGGDGSEGNPYDGLASVPAGIQAAGNTLYVLGDCTGGLDVAGSGSSGNPFVIRGDYPGNAGSIDGDGTHGILIDNEDWIEVRNIALSASSGSGFRGISISGTTDVAANVLVDGCTITNCVQNGVRIRGVTDVTISNNTISETTDDAILLDTDSVTIDGNTITAPTGQDGIQSIVVTSNADDITITNNTITKDDVVKQCIVVNGNRNIIRGNTLTGGANCLLIRGDEHNITRNKAFSISGSTTVFRSDNGVHTDNKINANILDGTAGCDFVMFLFQNTSPQVVHNVFVGNGSCEGLSAKNSSVVSLEAKNNIFTNCSVGLGVNSGQSPSESNNCYFKNDSDYLDQLSAAQTKTNPANIDPSLDANYRSQQPALSKSGVAVSGVTQDFDGKTFKDPPSIGAHELRAGSSVTTAWVIPPKTETLAAL